MSKKKNAAYKITKNYIGIDTGFIQASMVLDIAAQRAIESNDIRALIDVADSWVNMSVAMKQAIDPPEEVDDDEEAGSRHEKGSPIGFGVTVKDIKEHNDNIK